MERFNLNDSNGLLQEEDVTDLVENDQDRVVVEPSPIATPIPLLVKPIPKPRPVKIVSTLLPVRPIPKPRPVKTVSKSLPVRPIPKPRPDLELPAVNFEVHKKELKRPCKEDSEYVKKKKFDYLIKEISRAAEKKETISKSIEPIDINEAYDLVDEEIEDEVSGNVSDEDQPLQKESPVIEKINIDMAELIRYTNDNIYEILSII